MADKIVQLVDKNSNNLYPVAGAVIDNAVSTGAISSQAVTNAKIENGAVNGVANDATTIGTAKLALDTVGTPNLRDESVTSDKIDFTTLVGGTVRYADNQNFSANATTIVKFPNNVVTDTRFISYDDGTFTVKKAGWWLISAETGGSLNTEHTTMIFINGEEYFSNRGWSTDVPSARTNYIAATCCAKMNIGDTFDVRIYALASGLINSRSKGNVNACLISPVA